jgi:hypothetical protein
MKRNGINGQTRRIRSQSNETGRSVRKRREATAAPKPYQPVRRDFIERVAQVYRERGELWFREHNHHMDPELFDSALVGSVSVDAAGRLLSFTVRFGGSDNANDPLPFSQLVRVSCEPIDQIEQVQCRERASVSPGR